MATGLRLSINEKEFIEAALREEQRIDGRRPFDVRRLLIKFAKEDGAVEVQLGQTRVLAVVSGQLVTPYPDRPNEGTFAIFTEFSPMADPGFEPGRPGELAVELGRIIDRGLRESRAVDTESLCVLAGRSVWALRVDLHILDNGGNLVDAANMAALAGLLSYRRPECTVGGPDGQDVIVHPPEVREPLPLSIHHLPIAVSFALFGDGELGVLDPSLKEELVMGGRLTMTVNAHGEICAVQKGGGVGVSASELMRYLRIASTKAADLTATLKKEVEAHEIERAQRKIRRHRNFTTQDGERAMEKPTTIEGQGDILMKENVEAGPMEEEEISSDDDSSEGDDENDCKEGVVKPTVGMSKNLHTGGMFKGGASHWDAIKTIQEKGTSKLDSNLPFDAEAQAEFDKAAGDFVKETVSIPRKATGGFATPLQPQSLGQMAAAAIYAEQTARQRHGEDASRPLGPIFPRVAEMLPSEDGSAVLKGEPADALHRHVDSRTELTPGVAAGPQGTPLNLLAAVKKKPRKRKKALSVGD